MKKTNGPNGPEIAHLDYADHDKLLFSRRPLWWLFFKKASVVAIFDIRAN